MSRLKLIKKITKKVQSKQSEIISQKEVDNIIKSEYCSPSEEKHDFKQLNFN